MPRRWVLHVDLDQFIAAVEVLRRPELVGREVVVGGRGDPTERAVVSTASYEARARGVHSGMPLRLAARKAPDAVFLPVDKQAYEEASARVFAAIRTLGHVVEVLGWDEGFVGGRDDDPIADPHALAREIQTVVLASTDLHCSVGIGDNRVRAKMATDFGKPRGVFELTEDNWVEVMGERPTRALWGVGSKVSARLLRLGIETVDDLRSADPSALVAEFGPRMGAWYADLGHGRGSNAVDDTPWVARGHSRETTYQRNLVTADEVRAALVDLVEQVMEDVDAEARPTFRVTLKVRYAPFWTKTYSRKLAGPTSDREAVTEQVLALAERFEEGREIRLLGIRAELVMPEDEDPVERTPVRGPV